jgi:hypothetical protein
VLNDPARVIETEDVHPRILQVPRPDLVAVQDHMVTVGKRPLELDPLPGVVLRCPDEVIDERLLACLPSATCGL